MAMWKNKTITCPVCGSGVSLHYGFDGMGSNIPTNGTNTCVCGVIVGCDAYGNDLPPSIVNTKLINELAVECAVDTDGKLIVRVSNESKRKLVEYLQLIEKTFVKP